MGKAVSSATGLYYADLCDSEIDKMTKEFALLDQISGELRKDNRFRKLLDESLNETLYNDEQLQCIDYWISNHQLADALYHKSQCTCA